MQTYRRQANINYANITRAGAWDSDLIFSFDIGAA